MADYKEQKFTCGAEGLNNDFPDYEVVEHKIGNQTNADSNNNKFFSCELHKCSNGKWRVYTNYGRVSDTDYSGAVGIYGPDSESAMRSFFESKFKSKVRPSKGYHEISFIKAKVGSPKARTKQYTINESEIPQHKKDKVQSVAPKAVTTIQIHPQVKRLVDQWFMESSQAIQSNSAVKITSDGFETPLGVLSFSMIEKGRKILGDLGEAVKNNDTDEIAKMSGNFYTYIPTALGRKISTEHFISSDVLIQNKLDLLDMMESALEIGADAFVSKSDTRLGDLGAKVEFMDPKDSEWQRIENKVKATRGHNHNHISDTVLNIMTVETADRARYNNCAVGNELELWHGSRNCNCTGIMKKGLLIAPKEAPRSGLAFGRGIYAADKSTKSLAYSLYPFPNSHNSKNCFLYVVKCKSGKQELFHYGNGNEADRCKSKGYDSVFAKAGRGLIHNEYIYPTVEQVTITHIIELKR